MVEKCAYCIKFNTVSILIVVMLAYMAFCFEFRVSRVKRGFTCLIPLFFRE